MKNVGISVKDKLLNISRKTERSNEYLLIQYFYERFLYRLGTSRYKNKLILKGGMLLLSFDTINRTRPTKDLDFLATKLPLEETDIKLMMKEIFLTGEINDGVIFIPESIKVEKINEENYYNGIRIYFEAKLSKTRVRTWLHLDIGIGDLTVPKPVEMEYPVLLDFDSPIIIAYSKETVIAEKLETIVKRSAANSRLKDFYDILFLAKNNSFSYEKLKESVKATFNNRKTELPENTFFPAIIKEDDFMKNRWKAFVSRHEHLTNLSYEEMIEKLEAFTKPLLLENKDLVKWSNHNWRWNNI